YTYNICLGTTNSTGGYYLEGNYIDQNGNLTQLPIGKTPGTPVANGNINFKVTVSPWSAENNTSIYN
ncbi:MAG: hypothetical protein PHV49_06825, partial [Alistipes sp.]|nr:hypothetical protein [Alistipes sp.]